MKREILFRVWNKDKTEYYINTLLELISTAYYQDAVKSTFEQFTGVLDNDMSRIFEGDICKDRYGKIGVVEYFNDFGGFIVKRNLPDWIIHIQLDQGRNKFEIIGNIHDNPELL